MIILFRNCLALAFTVVSAMLCAQEKHVQGCPDAPGKMTAWMKANLALSESQAAKVEDINVEYTKKNLVLQSGLLSKRQKLQIEKTNEHAKDEELKAILTPEQFTAWISKKREIKESSRSR